MKAIFSIIMLLSFHKPIISQNSTSEIKDDIIERRIESMSDNLSETDMENNPLFDRLNYFYDHPVKLAIGCETELRELSLLTETQLLHLQEHIKMYGAIKDLEELQQVPLFDIQTIEHIKPFVRISEDIGIRNQVESPYHHFYKIRMQELIQKSRAYDQKNRIYPGSPMAIYSRYQFNYTKHLELGIAAEKDAGEKVYGDRIQAFDFQSAYVDLKKIGPVNRFIVGHYKISFGQALTYSSSAGMGKSSEVLLIQKTTGGMSPYRSLNENEALQGIAGTINLNSIEFTAFLSGRSLDATIIQTGNQSNITSFYTSGLHRTASEVNKKNAVYDRMGGGEILWKKSEMQIGLICVGQQLSHGLNAQPELYEMFRRKSAGLISTGIHFNLNRGNYSLFGEISKSFPGGRAVLAGLILMPDNRLTFAFSVRKFDVDYQTISSSAFGEKNLNQNEIGYYMAMKLKLTERSQWSVYGDAFEFPWLNYQVSAPSQGHEYFSEITHRFKSGQEILVRCKWKEIEKDNKEEGIKIPVLKKEIKKSLRLQFQMMAADFLRLRSRVEFSEFIFGAQRDQGMLVFEELKFSKMTWRCSIVLRYTLFDTESYQSRIYAFEQDLPGSYSIPSFSGTGSKFFILLNYKWSKSIKMSVKIGQLSFDDVESIGSGNDEITGSEKTEIKLLCQVKF